MNHSTQPRVTPPIATDGNANENSVIRHYRVRYVDQQGVIRTDVCEGTPAALSEAAYAAGAWGVSIIGVA